MKANTWLISFLIIVSSALCIIGYMVYYVDPYFHYHKPRVDEFYYALDNQRSQNDGIEKHFDYDAIITGSSMTENYRTSEMDKLFDCHSIKVSYSGGSYKEVNDGLRVALESNHNVKIVIRSIEKHLFLLPYDYMRYKPEMYPSYLYDNSQLNDVKYIFNRNVFFERVCPMIKQNKSGITSFDEYSRFQERYNGKFGYNRFYNEEYIDSEDMSEASQTHLSDKDRQMIKKNVELNITSLAKEYPDVDFYYFYPPYSISSWYHDLENGELYRKLEAEEYFTELILPYKNIHLFSFNNRTDITTDLNNYKDNNHYGCWVNSLMLKWMSEGKYQLTEDNYKEYFEKEYDYYTNYDYSKLLEQNYPLEYDDYEADFYAGALLNQEITGAEPIDVIREANIETTSDGIIKFDVDLSKGYNYLCFYCQKIDTEGVDDGCPLTVTIYDKEGFEVGGVQVDAEDLDYEIHQYALDLSTLNGLVTVEMQGVLDNASAENSEYLFSDIYMY